MAKRARESSLSGIDDLSTITSGVSLPVAPPLTVVARLPKTIHLQEEPSGKAVIDCRLPPHKPLDFTSFEDYEVHYRKQHINRCSECHKNFPTHHYLQLHQAENHSPINNARKDRGEKIYACFLEDCERLFREWGRRKLHMIHKHNFPEDYDFFIVNDGIGHRKSMLRERYRSRPQPKGRGGRFRRANSHHQSPTADQTEAEETCNSNSQSEKTLHARTTYSLHTRGGSRMRPKRLDDRTESLTPEQASIMQEPDGGSAPKPVDRDEDMDSIAKSLSTLLFVPRSVLMARARAKIQECGSE